MMSNAFQAITLVFASLLIACSGQPKSTTPCFESIETFNVKPAKSDTVAYFDARQFVMTCSVTHHYSTGQVITDSIRTSDGAIIRLHDNGTCREVVSIHQVIWNCG